MIALCSSTIDWSATGDMLSGFGTLAGVVAVVWAANKAANTFDNWKKQKIAERHIEQAERILTAIYKAKDALAYARGRISRSWEEDKAREQEQENECWKNFTKLKQDRIIHARARLNRLLKCRDEMEVLYACIPIAKALWGDDLHRAIEDFYRQFGVLKNYIDAYVYDEHGTDKDFTRSMTQAMYNSEEEPNNEISINVNKCIEVIESTLLPILRPEKTAR